MSILNYIEIIAAVAGLAVSILLCAFPRFGLTSWMLALALVPAVVMSAIQGLAPRLHWLRDELVLLSFACLVLCTAGGCVTSYMFERADFAAELKRNRWFFIVILALAPILIASILVFPPPISDTTVNLTALGLGGYVAAAYLLLISVVILANIEQTLRSAEEHVRWEIKFLLLGFAAIFGAIIYVASQVLLYPPEYAYLPWQALDVFPLILLCACFLIFVSWRRNTGRGRVVVSHGLVYSTITLFSVGVYLVATSLVARWLRGWIQSDVPVEPITFLASAILLSMILLGTSVRHRLRRWIRRNVFAGNYDYRRLWMDATEKVRSIDPQVTTATALAEIILDGLGSLDISVWLRARDAEIMRLTVARGTIAESFDDGALALASIPADLTEPIAINELAPESLNTWPTDFFKRAKASFVVPLISAGRLVGLLTVGSDRSGKGLDREAREFLRVLAVHAASEFHKSELLETLVQTREAEAFQTFATFLLHDLKNFASTLSLVAKNAVRHHGNPDFQLDAFRSILETAEKMKRLCGGLRTFSSNLGANKRPNDLNDIVHEVIRNFDQSLFNRLKLNVSPVPTVEVDRQDFSRVLQNLILNAHEASPDGPIELSTRFESGRVVVTVTDHGKGIPEDFLQKELFQPFRTTKPDGLGIGLFQCKKIIEAHDGTISVESREGEGTIVRIIVPLLRSERTVVTALGPDAAGPNFATEERFRHATAKS